MTTEAKDHDDSTQESAAGTTRFMLDKRIPLVALIGFLIQFGGLMWYASQQDMRVKNLEALMATAQQRTTTLEAKTGDLVLVNFRLTAVEGTTNRIEAKLDAMAEKDR